MYFLTVEYIALYFTPPPPTLLATLTLFDRRWSVGVWWWVETGVEWNSRYTTAHYTLFPSSRCTARPYLSFSAPNPRPPNNNTNNLPRSRKVRNLNFTSLLQPRLPSSTTPSFKTLFSGPTGPSAPLHLSVCSHCEPTKSPQHSTFAPKCLRIKDSRV